MVDSSNSTWKTSGCQVWRSRQIMHVSTDQTDRCSLHEPGWPPTFPSQSNLEKMMSANKGSHPFTLDWAESLLVCSWSCSCSNLWSTESTQELFCVCVHSLPCAENMHPTYSNSKYVIKITLPTPHTIGCLSDVFSYDCQPQHAQQNVK